MDQNCQYCGGPLDVEALNCPYCNSIVPGARERAQARAEAEAEAAAARAQQEAAEAQAKAEVLTAAIQTVGSVIGASLRNKRTQYSTSHSAYQRRPAPGGPGHRRPTGSYGSSSFGRPSRSGFGGPHRGHGGPRGGGPHGGPRGRGHR